MEPNTTSMQEKICLVTGATSGIGLVSARELARMGARVVIVGRNRAKTEAALAQIRAEAGSQEVEALLADLSNQQQVRELVAYGTINDKGEVLLGRNGESEKQAAANETTARDPL